MKYVAIFLIIRNKHYLRIFPLCVGLTDLISQVYLLNIESNLTFSHSGNIPCPPQSSKFNPTHRTCP